jgi:arabinosyltransferase C
LLADPQQRANGGDWSSASAGGPLAWIRVVGRQRVVPLYLQGQWDRDPGQLRLLLPWSPATGAPDVVTGSEERWGWEDQGPTGAPPAGRPTPVR